jgi:hypothetical protein
VPADCASHTAVAPMCRHKSAAASLHASVHYDLGSGGIAEARAAAAQLPGGTNAAGAASTATFHSAASQFSTPGVDASLRSSVAASPSRRRAAESSNVKVAIRCGPPWDFRATDCSCYPQLMWRSSVSLNPNPQAPRRSPRQHAHGESTAFESIHFKVCLSTMCRAGKDLKP